MDVHFWNEKLHEYRKKMYRVVFLSVFAGSIKGVKDNSSLLNCSKSFCLIKTKQKELFKWNEEVIIN